MRMLLALVATVLFTATSQAKDRPADAAYNWTGLYAGAHIGKAWGDSGNSWRNASAGYPDWEPDGNISYSSVTGGLHAGYLWQRNALVYGIEGDVSWASLEGNDSQFAGLVNAIEIDFVGTIRARAGIARANSLIYATGGIAFSSMDKKDLSSGNSAKHDLVGWTVGGGYEHAIGSKLRARVEYQYIDFGSVVSGLIYDHRANDVRIHAVRAGLSYGF